MAKEPNILQSTEVHWKGTLYKKGFFLCESQGESTEFRQIELLLAHTGEGEACVLYCYTS